MTRTLGKLIVAAACVLASTLAQAAVEQREVNAPPPPPAFGPGSIWPSEPPADCPFSPSATLKGLRFTGRHAEYTAADTWYPSWASDGNLYSPFTDGSVNNVNSWSVGPSATTGNATIVGNDPLKLQVINPGVYHSDPSPYGGRYPCANFVHDGVWYYGTYCLGPSPVVPHDGLNYNWPWLGPFVGFRYSTDFGKTWTETPHTPAKPLFGETGLKGEALKIGSPHVVDFGKNMEQSPDGKAYLVCHGATDPDPQPRFANLCWGTGDQLYLIRVKPSIANINDASKYEFFAGFDRRNHPVWSGEFSRIKPLAEWNNNMGCVTMTYNAPLKKYLMCVLDAMTTLGYANTYILESDQIAGPWRLLTYMKHFGEQAYFVNVPSKFIRGDGRTMWLCYAANFAPSLCNVRLRARPPGGRYGMCLQEVNILSPNDPIPPVPPSASLPSPLDTDNNVAWKAAVTVTSTCPGYSAVGATDGIVGGYPKDPSSEWASQGEKDTAMLRLTWTEPQKVDRVWLFDRPTKSDRITSSMLVFSDGSTIQVGALPNDAKKGIEVKFEPKTIKWLALIVTGVSPETTNVGLSEIAVFRAAK